MPNLTGQSIGRYHILEQLGEGGMATVYKAYDTRLERNVAFKVLRADLFGQAVLDQVLKRFEREAKSLAKLSHPNIVNILDYGEHEATPYLVMEYLPGGTLKQQLGKQIPWQEAIQIILPVAQGLSYAHEHNVIHRDVKPANILMKEGDLPVLTDFGIAKLLEGADGHTLTASGVGIGTPEYMAPEQGIGASTIDARADIYSLGIVLYEMVTGRKPYVADTPMAVVLKQMTDPLPRPTDFVPDLPEEAEQILLKALAKEPEDRYLDMISMIAAMESALADLKKVDTLPETKKVEVETPAPPHSKKQWKKAVTSRIKLSPRVVMSVVGALAIILIFSLGAPWLIKQFSAGPETHAISTSKSVIQPAPTLTFPSPSETSEIPNSQSPIKFSTPTNIPLIQINEMATSILAYISENPPTFEDDFSAKNMAWGSTSEGLAIFALVDQDVLTVTDHGEDVDWTTDHAIPGLSFPVNKLFNSRNFVLEYDFSFYRGVDSIGIHFRSTEGLNDGYKIIFLVDGTWWLNQNVDSTITSGKYPIKEKFNNFRVIVHDNYLAFFLNNELIHEADNLLSSGTTNQIALAGNHGSQARFDNVKFWNLDEVNIPDLGTPAPSASDPTWVTDFAEPILQNIQSREPDFQDDFESKTNFWAPSEWCAANVRVANGVMDILSRCHIFWTRNYDNFVVSFDYRSESNGSHIIMFYVRQSFPPEGCFFQLAAGSASWDCEPSNIDLGNFTNLSTNHALIIVRNNQFALFINNQPVNMIQVESLKWGNSMLENSTQVQIDNFKLWRIE